MVGVKWDIQRVAGEKLEVGNGGETFHNQAQNERGRRNGEQGLVERIVLFQEKGDLFQHLVSTQVQWEQPRYVKKRI